jgi:hypothetical protein
VLKTDKARNKDLLDSIQRLEVYTNALKTVKRNEKELRFEKSKMMELESKPKEQEPDPQPEIVVNNYTMNLKTMREMKYDYTQLSNLSADYISEKDAIEAIYARIFEEKQQARTKQKREAGFGNNLFLTGLGGTHQREGALKETIEKILNEDYKAIANLSKEEVLSAIRSIYE